MAKKKRATPTASGKSDRKPVSREEAHRTVKQITDLMFKLSVNAGERQKYLASPKNYLAKTGLSERTREIMGSLNEKLILGQIYELRPDLKPIPLIYTFTDVTVDIAIIISPIALVAIYLAPGE